MLKGKEEGDRNYLQRLAFWALKATTAEIKALGSWGHGQEFFLKRLEGWSRALYLTCPP